MHIGFCNGLELIAINLVVNPLRIKSEAPIIASCVCCLLVIISCIFVVKHNLPPITLIVLQWRIIWIEGANYLNPFLLTLTVNLHIQALWKGSKSFGYHSDRLTESHVYLRNCVQCVFCNCVWMKCLKVNMALWSHPVLYISASLASSTWGGFEISVINACIV